MKKTRYVGIRMYPDTYSKLETVAHLNDITISHLLNCIIEDYLNYLTISKELEDNKVDEG